MLKKEGIQSIKIPVYKNSNSPSPSLRKPKNNINDNLNTNNLMLLDESSEGSTTSTTSTTFSLPYTPNTLKKKSEEMPSMRKQLSYLIENEHSHFHNVDTTKNEQFPNIPQNFPLNVPLFQPQSKSLDHLTVQQLPSLEYSAVNNIFIQDTNSRSLHSQFYSLFSDSIGKLQEASQKQVQIWLQDITVVVKTVSAGVDIFTWYQNPTSINANNAAEGLITTYASYEGFNKLSVSLI
ncbi:MAG: hypothetical protein HRU36_01700 [Rickettsiales bacterium]|nr:hypothetical protein [Rickettsiales bacterium]